MVDFNFGFIAGAIEKAKHADSKVDLSPIEGGEVHLINQDSGNFTESFEMIISSSNILDGFMWGEQWGSSSRVGL